MRTDQISLDNQIKEIRNNLHILYQGNEEAKTNAWIKKYQNTKMKVNELL